MFEIVFSITSSNYKKTKLLKKTNDVLKKLIEKWNEMQQKMKNNEKLKFNKKVYDVITLQISKKNVQIEKNARFFAVIDLLIINWKKRKVELVDIDFESIKLNKKNSERIWKSSAVIIDLESTKSNEKNNERMWKSSIVVVEQTIADEKSLMNDRWKTIVDDFERKRLQWRQKIQNLMKL